MSHEETLKLLVLDEIVNYTINLEESSLNFEEYLIGIIKQSRYLKLLVDRGIYHLRLDINLESSKYQKDYKLAEYLLSTYPMNFDEQISWWRSGDINRIFLAKGHLNY